MGEPRCKLSKNGMAALTTPKGAGGTGSKTLTACGLCFGVATIGLSRRTEASGGTVMPF